MARALDINTQSALSRSFKALHTPGSPILLTNVWDPPSAALALRNPKTKALATASYAIAAVNGIEDDDLTLQDSLAALRKITEQMAREKKSHQIPLTVDLQSGYGEKLEEAVVAVVHLGAVGINLEDSRAFGGDLVPIDEQVSRIKQAISVAKREGVEDFVVNARTDAVVCGKSIDEAVARGKRYLEAGATTIFVWGGPARGLRDNEVQTLVRELGGKINVKLNDGPGYLTVGDLAELGVARISLGPGLWKAAMAEVERRIAMLLE